MNETNPNAREQQQILLNNTRSGAHANDRQAMSLPPFLSSASYPPPLYQGPSQGQQIINTDAGRSLLPQAVLTTNWRSHAGYSNPSTLSNPPGSTSLEQKRGGSEALGSGSRTSGTQRSNLSVSERLMPNAHHSPIVAGSTSSRRVIINRAMATTKIVAHLGEHGCEDITELLDMTTASEWPISSGGFGDIYKVKLHDHTEVAVKTTRIHVTSASEGRKYLKSVARELHTWSKCRHPNVIKLLGLVMFRGKIGMVSIWMENGNLPNYLSNNPRVDRCVISRQISEGLSYLHKSDIVHGDLKGANILVSRDGVPMLTDFGNSTLNNQSILFTDTSTKAGISLRWTAPELFASDKPRVPSKEADVYALGMTILETITGKLPYCEKSEQSVMFSVWQGKFPDRPKEIPVATAKGDILWALLVRCWAYDPEERLEVAEVVKRMKTITGDGFAGVAH